VALFCGDGDLLSSTPDYEWLRDELEKSGSLCFYGEYKLGHLGLLMPEDQTHFQDIF